MSLALHWTCDGCGRREIRAHFGFPPGWVVVGDRGTSHRCPECAPTAANPSPVRRLLRWCQRHPALACVLASNLLVLVALGVGSTLAALRVDRLRARITELEQAQASRPLPEPRPAPLRP
jgi:hypothetical protein